jgi:hypothetical protein
MLQAHDPARQEKRLEKHSAMKREMQIFTCAAKLPDTHKTLHSLHNELLVGE